ncbi:GNAT family N-acetyltransferase [Actinoplanes regularis]|uniref:GNAT family N-acetyltransferase n=1 Tax=Actinoplanes regularis TaxID=52697 RepID=UPI0024A0558A|nr:GNAT family N-acetyltransferase [Actinoplanes regularis]GLW33371.1 N-acetyltransferase [Actinoplanes regularis]
MEIKDVPEKGRFEARDEAGALAGILTYQVTGQIVVYTHTSVEPNFERQGVGSALAQAAMEDARAKSRTVVPICEFVLEWLKKHPEYESIVARTTRHIK